MSNPMEDRADHGPLGQHAFVLIGKQQCVDCGRTLHEVITQTYDLGKKHGASDARAAIKQLIVHDGENASVQRIEQLIEEMRRG